MNEIILSTGSRITVKRVIQEDDEALWASLRHETINHPHRGTQTHETTNKVRALFTYYRKT